MPCNGTFCGTDVDVCVSLSYGFTFLELNTIGNNTFVEYEVCSCDDPNISHINLEVCGEGISPEVNVTLTQLFNPTTVTEVEVRDANEGQNDPVPFTSVKIDFADVFEANECIILTLVYDGIFTEGQLSDGFVAVKAGNGEIGPGIADGLPLLLDCAAVECPNSCPDCTDREIAFETVFTLPDVICTLTPLGVVFDGLCTSLDCEVSQCQTPVEIEVCPGETIVCCVTLDAVTFTGTVDLVWDVAAELEVECPPGTIAKDFLIVESIDIDQTCFQCEGTGDCEAIDVCDLFDVTFDVVVEGQVVTINGTLTFLCPPTNGSTNG